MARGKKPQKKLLLSLQANPRPCTTNPNPVEFAIDDPRMPDWLDSLARAKWHDLVNGLRPMAILSPVDADSIAVYCALYAQVVRCQQQIDLSGGFVQEEGRPLKSHPAVDQLTALSARLFALGKALGLTPMARSKLVADPIRQERNWVEELCGVQADNGQENI